MDREKVMSWLEGLSEPDWRVFHSDSEVQNIAKSALELLKEQKSVVLCKDCKNRGDINICPLAYIEKTEQFTALCVDEWFCGSGERKEVK